MSNELGSIWTYFLNFDTENKRTDSYYEDAEQPHLFPLFCYIGYDEETPSNSHLYICHKHLSNSTTSVSKDVQETRTSVADEIGETNHKMFHDLCEPHSKDNTSLAQCDGTSILVCLSQKALISMKLH